MCRSVTLTHARRNSDLLIHGKEYNYSLLWKKLMSFAECSMHNFCLPPPTFYKTTSSVTFTTDILQCIHIALYSTSFPGFLSLAVKKRDRKLGGT